MTAIDWSDTIVAPATGSGSACRAILRMTGPRSHEIASNSLADASAICLSKRTALAIRLSIETWQRTVAADLYCWPAGRSLTGQPTIEAHLPACEPLVSAVENEWIGRGARPARNGEFTLRAFLAGKLDLVQAEGILGLIDARLASDLIGAIDQRSGGPSERIRRLRSRLLDLLADIEAGLDFADEDITIISAPEMTRQLEAAKKEMEELAERWGGRSLHNSRVRVLLIGPPNAGKSSLFNVLVQRERALVSPIAGTTTDYVTAELRIDGVEIELIDTAGVDDAPALPDGGVHTNGSARRSAEADRLRDCMAAEADILIWCSPVDPVGDVAAQPEKRGKVLRVRTKCDLEAISLPSTPCNCDLATSVLIPASMENLRREIARRALSIRSHEQQGAISERSRQSLVAASDAIHESLSMAQSGKSPEYVVVPLRAALDHLGEIIGAVYTEDLLDRVFSRFCIGK